MKGFELPGTPCMLRLRATMVQQLDGIAVPTTRELPITTERRGSAWYDVSFNSGYTRGYTCCASDPVLALVNAEWLVLTYVSTGKWLGNSNGAAAIAWESGKWHYGGPFGHVVEEPIVWAYLPEHEAVKELVMSSQMVRNIVEEKCMTCQGTKVMLMNNAEQRCVSCGGTGKAPVVNKKEEIRHDRHTQ